MGLNAVEIEKKIHFERFFFCMVGGVIYAVGVNMFIVPFNLYSGGIVGIAQLIRTLLADYIHLDFGSKDVAGIIFYAINVPILLYAFPRLEKLFFLKTIVAVTSLTLAMSFIPTTMVVNDCLASTIVGAFISGAGIGLVLRNSGSTGGMDVIGMLISKAHGNISVGRVNLSVNLVLYAICLFLFDVQIVVYSVIFAVVHAFAIDRFHSQNINVEAKIITKVDPSLIENVVFTEMGRGVTELQSVGAYTQESEHILYILISKYEVHQLRNIVRKYDKNAFIVFNEGVWVEGNYLKKF
ncbi:MAG: YitT family protein [Spirochaetales bacterium]|nr:YitT family protein [Spirochaetales bacterium]MBQ3729511.1 YitT family protein [Spirochaetales bacterium]MBQ9809874.1 YitT family protein [Spirochaetales bacterium]